MSMLLSCDECVFSLCCLFTGCCVSVTNNWPWLLWPTKHLPTPTSAASLFSIISSEKAGLAVIEGKTEWVMNEPIPHSDEQVNQIQCEQRLRWWGNMNRVKSEPMMCKYLLPFTFVCFHVHVCRHICQSIFCQHRFNQWLTQCSHGKH